MASTLTPHRENLQQLLSLIRKAGYTIDDIIKDVARDEYKIELKEDVLLMWYAGTGALVAHKSGEAKFKKRYEALIGGAIRKTRMQIAVFLSREWAWLLAFIASATGAVFTILSYCKK